MLAKVTEQIIGAECRIQLQDRKRKEKKKEEQQQKTHCLHFLCLLSKVIDAL